MLTCCRWSRPVSEMAQASASLEMPQVWKGRRSARWLENLWRRGSKAPGFERYSVALTAAAVMSVARIALDPYWGARFPYIFFFPATLFSALYAGFGPALAGIALMALAATTWILPPIGIPSFRTPLDAVSLGIYVWVDGLIAWLGAAHRHLVALADRQTEELRERQTLLSASYDAAKLQEQIALRARRDLEIITDLMAAAVSRCTSDLRYGWANRRYAEWIGRPLEEIVGRPIVDVIGAEAFNSLQPHFQQVLAGKRVDYEEEISFSTLGLRWIEASYVPIQNEHGTVDSWVAQVLDITERKRMELALEEMSRRKDEFLATLAHELRNPLAPIRQAAAIVSSDGTTEAQKHWGCAVIERQVKHMARLLDDLLDVSRISRGVLVLRKQPIDLQSVLMSAAETVRSRIESRRHKLVWELPPEPITIDADALRIEQVFVNILNNAAKFSDPDGLIRIVVHQRGTSVAVSIEDRGIGIPQEQQRNLFQMFSQLPSTREYSDGGLGIGLALAKGIVELHGGTIEVFSAGSKLGSRFTVHLPVEPGMTGTAVEVSTAHEVPLERRRILIADDNRDAAETLAVLLRSDGQEVTIACDGEVAFEEYLQSRPDVILLDMGMPKMDGYEVARRIRAESGDKPLIIAITGWGQDHDRERTRQVGIEHHMTKPIDYRALVSVINASTRSTEYIGRMN